VVPVFSLWVVILEAGALKGAEHICNPVRTRVLRHGIPALSRHNIVVPFGHIWDERDVGVVVAYVEEHFHVGLCHGVAQFTGVGHRHIPAVAEVVVVPEPDVRVRCGHNPTDALFDGQLLVAVGNDPEHIALCVLQRPVFEAIYLQPRSR